MSCIKEVIIVSYDTEEKVRGEIEEILQSNENLLNILVQDKWKQKVDNSFIMWIAISTLAAKNVCMQIAEA